MRPRYQKGAILSIKNDKEETLYYYVYDVSKKRKIPSVVLLSDVPNNINKLNSSSLSWSAQDHSWTLYGLDVSLIL